MSRSSRLPTINIRVVGTSQMVFTNLIMITHVHKTTYKPPMSSIIIGRYKSKNLENPKGGY